MKYLMFAAAAAGAMFAVSTPASARDGCGTAFHRNYNGRCVPNRGPAYRGDRYRDGVFYSGRGYWSGGRFWQHRYRHHRGWRYR